MNIGQTALATTPVAAGVLITITTVKAVDIPGVPLSTSTTVSGTDFGSEVS